MKLHFLTVVLITISASLSSAGMSDPASISNSSDFSGTPSQILYEIFSIEKGARKDSERT